MRLNVFCINRDSRNVPNCVRSRTLYFEQPTLNGFIPKHLCSFSAHLYSLHYAKSCLRHNNSRSSLLIIGLLLYNRNVQPCNNGLFIYYNCLADHFCSCILHLGSSLVHNRNSLPYNSSSLVFNKNSLLPNCS